MSSLQIGLTGGPGCGKSEVGRIFSTFSDWQCFDADRICAEIYSEPDSPVVKLFRDRWGGDCITPDGLPDKKVIAEKVFQQEEERVWLNSVLHPEIFFRLQNYAAQSTARIVLIEAPLLFESQWQINMDKTIAVWSPPDVQMMRLIARGWTPDHARKRINAQLSAEKKLELADFAIINRSTVNAMRKQCLRLDRIIKQNFL